VHRGGPTVQQAGHVDQLRDLRQALLPPPRVARHDVRGGVVDAVEVRRRLHRSAGVRAARRHVRAVAVHVAFENENANFETRRSLQAVQGLKPGAFELCVNWIQQQLVQPRRECRREQQQHRGVALQVEFERQTLKPGFHLIGYRLWA
jgi:hypothetical protein